MKLINWLTIQTLMFGKHVRWFTELKPLSSSQIATLSQSYTGDFDISFNFRSNQSDTVQVVLGYSVNASNFIYYNGSTGQLFVRYSDDNLTSVGTYTGNISGRLKLEGSILSLYINGVLDNSRGVTVDTFTIDLIGANAFGSYFAGFIWDVDFGDGRPFYRLDSSPGQLPNYPDSRGVGDAVSSGVNVNDLTLKSPGE